jgi:lipid A ethanolaminephosphotransferase
VHLDKVDALCSADACFDEILVYQLKKLLTKVTGDTLIVLHQLGSHGPAYYRRYPDRYRVFLPDCRSPNFGDCDDEQIANSYDNTILYTDHVISAAIDALVAESDRIIPSLIYMSDHGESLGEHNLFLHGMPYQFAPAEQTHVPMITWISSDAERIYGPLSDCADAKGLPISHDNLFHTELGLLDIATEIYDEKLDLYSSCRSLQHARRAEVVASHRT